MDSYLFPTGAIKGTETKLLDKNDLERMVDSPNAEASYKIFRELSYADELLEIDNPERYREVLEHDLGQTVVFLKLVSPDRQLTEFILSPFDFDNVKILYKVRLAGGAESAGLSPWGAVETEKLKELVLTENPAVVVAAHIAAAVSETRPEAKDPSAPERIDDCLNRLYYGFLKERAHELKDFKLVDLVVLSADLANAKIAARSKLLNMSVSDFSRKLVPGGAINRHFFYGIYQKKLPELIKAIGAQFIDPRLADEIRVFLDRGDYERLERAFDNTLIARLKEIKMGGHGPATLAAFFWGKLNSIKNIQIIMAGKLNNIPPPEIKKYLRDLY